MHARRRAIQAAFCLILLPAAYAPAAHAQGTPGQGQNANQVPERLVGSGNGHNQPTRQQTNARLRQDKVAPTQQQRQDQLNTLNQLNQKLMPGSQPLAPEVKPAH